jgi:tetratricopeptide (TPR) repeat protein
MKFMAQSEKARYSAWIVLSLFLTIVAWQPLAAQFAPLSSPAQAPQAKSQAELDAYLEIISATEPPDIVKKVDVFASQFPASAFLSLAYQNQALAFQRLGDFDGSVSAGEKSLRENPQNAKTLLMLAAIIANGPVHHPDRVKLLSQAADYAHRALQDVDTIKPPRQISLEQWALEKQQMQCQAHEALGVVSLDRGQAHAAVTEFQAALALAPHAEGALFLRLGLALALAGQPLDAEKNLLRAEALGPDSVRQLAAGEIRKLRQRKQAEK